MKDSTSYHSAVLDPQTPAQTDQIVSLLQRELAIARELTVHLRRASRTLRRRFHPRVAVLLAHLNHDLLAQRRLLAQRLEEMSPGCSGTIGGLPARQNFWALFPTSDADCRSHLDALVAGYARFMRFTSDISAALNLLDDQEGVRILQHFTTAGNRGLWFLEIYLEGLALHMDESHLPPWLEHIPCV
jgi:hypothetical protein